MESKLSIKERLMLVEGRITRLEEDVQMLVELVKSIMVLNTNSTINLKRPRNSLSV